MKKKNKGLTKQILLTIAGLILSVGTIYGFYWAVKTFSYWLFYEDMVQETIKQMIKPEYLRQLSKG